ncbi:dihydrolipoyl dehydrogenase [Clostridiales Family XIII bacterium ASD5510]|uniref:Dihydrolipoyl dehydrogenase n=1 Tax=Hominibacterium faecale TaxID=2839743 RepID=A0A9J6QW67_9FIRM|nr:dihydrolipoyl dehydrogenase [Hominibacterium faecale]MCU7378942.1 dihydrolipoyl dehydrogenase [Hominibacterium faecale]
MKKKTITTKMAILGGGPAGYMAAIRCVQYGVQPILIEEKQVGGVCLNEGCIPTKALLKTADAIKDVKKMKEYGINLSFKQLDWGAAINRKNRIVKSLHLGLISILQARNVNILSGKGSVVDANTILVETEQGEINIQCEAMILCTGSLPILPSIKGTELPHVMTSTEALELETIPQNIAIIGGGVMGLEFASIFRAAGSDVTLLEQTGMLPFGSDTDISDELQRSLKRQGFKIRLQTEVKEIEKGAVLFKSKGKEERVTCDKVLIAVGRKANTTPLKALELKTKEGFVLIDSFLQTSRKGVYAAGDLIGGSLLAHAAFMEGRLAAENALGHPKAYSDQMIPSCIYTSPEIAVVGASEDGLRKSGVPFKIGKFSFRNNGRALAIGDREGFVKVLANEDNQLLGGQIIGMGASELISEFTLAITLGAKADVLADMVHPHPSLSEAIWEACAEVCDRPIHKL